MQELSLDCEHGEKRRDFGVGGCGPLGRSPGPLLLGAFVLPPMLQSDEDGLRFGDGLGPSLLPDPVFQFRCSARPGCGDQFSHWFATGSGFGKSRRLRHGSGSKTKSVWGATSAISVRRQYYPSNLINPSNPD